MMGGMDCCGVHPGHHAGCPNARAVVTVPVEIRRPVTADVQPELAEALRLIETGPEDGPGWNDVAAAELLPTVQALIADAEKRAAAAAAARAAAYAYEQGYDACRHGEQRRNPYHARAAALDPAGAASGETT